MERILVVDDERPIREWLSFCVTKHFDRRFAVDLAANGQEALALVTERHYHLVFTDIKMPVMDGIELARRIGELGAGTRVIVLTSFDDFGLVRSAFKLGVYDYIRKTEITGEYLAELIDQCLDGRTQALPAPHPAAEVESCGNPSVDAALRYIESNYKTITGLTEVAGAVFLSPEYFSRLFKEVVGSNFSGYLNNLRLEKSVELMRRPELRIYQIAEQVGFSQLSYYSQSFKKKFGVNPFKYRSSLTVRDDVRA